MEGKRKEEKGREMQDSQGEPEQQNNLDTC